MEQDHLRRVAKIGLLSALGVLAIAVFRVPGPGGNVYFHLGEVVIVTSAILLGKKSGAAIGAISAVIADILLGVALWAPFSLVIHGLEGFVIGTLADGKGGRRDLFAASCGIAVMVVGYTLTAGLLYGAPVMPVEFAGDLCQGVLGLALSFAFLRAVLTRFPGIARKER